MAPVKTATVSLAGIRRRLDAIAIEHLRNEVQSLAMENEELREQLYLAEQSAEAWRDDALNFQIELCDRDGGSPGMTRDGSLVVVPQDRTA